MQRIEILFGRKTDRGSFTIKADESYFYGDQDSILDQFSNLLAFAVKTVEAETGIELSVEIVRSTTVVCTKDSTNETAKETFTVSSVRNPNVYGEIKQESWKLAFVKVAEFLKEELEQSNIVVDFCQTEFFAIA